MCGPLLVNGGDELQPGNEAQDRSLVAAAAGRPIFLVPTAAVRQDLPALLTLGRSWFAGLGAEARELPVRRPADARSAELAAMAAAAGAIYLLGGDPGYAVKALAGSPVWAAILTAWRGGAGRRLAHARPLPLRRQHAGDGPLAAAPGAQSHPGTRSPAGARRHSAPRSVRPPLAGAGWRVRAGAAAARQPDCRRSSRGSLACARRRRGQLPRPALHSRSGDRRAAAARSRAALPRARRSLPCALASWRRGNTGSTTPALVRAHPWSSFTASARPVTSSGVTI